MDEVESIALQLVYKKIEKNNKRTVIGQPMPNITTIIKDKLNKEDFYRLSSAMAHGQHWAFSKCALKRISSDNIFEIHISPLYIFYLIFEGAHAFMFPLWYKAQLYG